MAHFCIAVLNAAGERAIAQAPAVFFIDEIDSFHARGKQSSSGYILGVVNGLLTLLDRLNQTPGVIVIAATNHPGTVDPAVIRAGRFDRHLPVGPLDRAGIRAMLTAEIGEDVLSEAECNDLVDQLSGGTGADLAGLIREARTRARRAKAVLTAQHVREAADRRAPRLERDLQRRIATHEAGHMLAGHLFGLPMPTRAQLNARNGFIATPHFDIVTPERIDSQIRGDLGGYAAEQIAFGTASNGSGGGADSDLSRATRRALQAELSYGFGETLSWQPVSTDLQHLSERQRARIEQQLQRALLETRQALQSHRADLERIADALLRERELDRDRIAALLRGIPVTRPASQPQAKEDQERPIRKRAPTARTVAAPQ